MTAAPEAPVDIDLFGDIGQAFINSRIGHVNVGRDWRPLLPETLPRETVEDLRAVHVPGSDLDDMLSVLQRQRAIGLIGRPGDGRRITAVRLAADLGLTPHDVLFDADEPGRHLPMSPGHAYLLALDGLDRPGPAARDALLGHLHRLPEGSVLAFRATAETWRDLGLDECVPACRVHPPSDPVTVFAAHLAVLQAPATADDWRSVPEIRAELANARPGEAVRLARIVRKVLKGTARDRPTQVAEVIAAYRNWTEELDRWFAETGGASDAGVRALKAAAAALEGAPATVVFDAAERLTALVGMPPEPGHGLVGPGADELIERVQATCHGAEGRVRFPRPEYADSVLAHLWQDRPHLRDALRRWLAEIPDRDPETHRAARTVTRVAVRHGDREILIKAAGRWARHPDLRPLAAEALTTASVSRELGRDVRRLLYGWAKHSRLDVVHLLVAEVCAGPFADAFPEAALTRLRHLADRDGAHIRTAVVAALVRLASGGMLPPVLREICGWTADGEERGRAATGREAFLALTALRTGDRVTVLPDAPDVETDALLTGAWRAVLRAPGTRGRAVEAAIGWLELTAQTHAAPRRVTMILADTCRTSRDRGILHAIAWTWERGMETPAILSRRDICERFLDLVADRDPLTALKEHAGAE